ncbi:hypothetical protein ACFQX6_32195 [Streptosporangium lutulentum]
MFTLVPFYWMLVFAFRPRGSSSLLPWPITFDNFAVVWNELGFAIFFKNSLMVGVASLIMTTVIALAAATPWPATSSAARSCSWWGCSARSSFPAP